MARAMITAAGRTIRGEYHGGEYIDLSFGGSAEAFDCINVWDYDRSTARIPNTASAVRRALVEWRNEYGDSLSHDLAEYALSMRDYR